MSQLPVEPLARRTPRATATGAQAHPVGWHRIVLILFGGLGWITYVAGWVWAIETGLPRYWFLLVLVPPMLIGGFFAYSVLWVGWNRRATAGGERRFRPADEQPQTHHDRLGRPLIIDPACHGAAQVEIILDGEAKVVRLRGAHG